MKMTTTCSESLVANGWRLAGTFKDGDDAAEYRRRLNRAGAITHLHNCPQDHGNPHGAWAVWKREGAQ